MVTELENGSLRSSEHPTRALLIATTMRLMKHQHPDDIKVSTILRESRVSKGSLYYHFKDSTELFNVAEVGRYIEEINQAVAVFEMALSDNAKREEIIARLKQATEWALHPDAKKLRRERIGTLGRAMNNSDFMTALAVVQTQTTARIADVIERAQNEGLVRQEVNPKVFAVFIQSYSLGRIVDDISTNPIANDDWTNFINKLLLDYLISPNTPN